MNPHSGYKILQFKAPVSGALKALAQEFLTENFPRHTVFAQEALKASGVVYYVSGKKAPLTMKNVRAKAPITLCLCPDSHNLMNKLLLNESIAMDSKGLMVVHKASGLPSQTTFKAWEDNLTHQILLHLLLKKDFPGQLPYLGMHHRLDRDTSGLLLFTIRPSENKAVSELFKGRKIRKTYLALVEGEAPQKNWVNNLCVKRGKNPKHKFYFTTSESEGDSAQSKFKFLGSVDQKTHWIQCSPVTGRTHQLRVHLQADGFGIVGDHVYGVRGKEKPMRLHAQSLEFEWKGENILLETRPQWPETLPGSDI